MCFRRTDNLRATVVDGARKKERKSTSKGGGPGAGKTGTDDLKFGLRVGDRCCLSHDQELGMGRWGIAGRGNRMWYRKSTGKNST